MPSLVQTVTVSTGNASSATALPITIPSTTVGNTLVAVLMAEMSGASWTIGSVTDGANTFTVRDGRGHYGGARPGGTDIRVAIAFARVTTGGNRTINFNLSGAPANGTHYWLVGCMEWSGISASLQDAFDANEDVDLVSTDISAGPITTTQAAALLVGVAGIDSADSAINWASPASWTNAYRQNNTQLPGWDVAYWLPGSIQTNYTAQWSHDNTGSGFFGAGVIVALLPETAPPPEPFMKVEIRAAP